MLSFDGFPQPLVGRRAEIAEISAALLEQDARLVTVTGVNGVGKTHLAQAVTTQLAGHFPDGVFVIPAENIDGGEFLLPAIAHAVGARESAGLEPIQSLRHALANMVTLITIDGVELTAGDASDIGQLLAACPAVKLLVTSTSPLDLAGEIVVELEPLPVPDTAAATTPNELSENDAVRLLVNLVRVTDPQFAVTEANASAVSAICTLLDGLPLAIELAAAQLRSQSPSSLLQRLSNAKSATSTYSAPSLPPTLNAAITVSEESLSPLAERLFHHLSIFTGDFNIDAIQNVCGELFTYGDEPTGEQVSAAVSELLDCLLLRQVDSTASPRFYVPRPIAEYAASALRATNAADKLRARYAIHFLMLAEEAAPALNGPLQETWLQRLQADNANIRVALRWSLHERPAFALRFAAALWRFWLAKGYLREGRQWIERALAAEFNGSPILRARALSGLARLVFVSGDPDRALQLHNASYVLASEWGNLWEMTFALAHRGYLEFVVSGKTNRARQLTVEALANARVLGDRLLEGIALTTLGQIAKHTGDLKDATARLQEAVDITREAADNLSLHPRLFQLGQLARSSGDLTRAIAFQCEALDIAERLNCQEENCLIQAAIAGIAVDNKEFERAVVLLTGISTQATRLSIAVPQMELAQIEQDLATARASLPDIVFREAQERGRVLSLPAAAQFARDLAGSRAPEPVIATRSTPDGGKSGSGRWRHGQRLRRQGSEVQRESRAELSQRELQILLMLANGSSDRQIADALFISTDTASTHVRNIRRKLGVHSRSAAVAYGIRRALI